LTSGVKSEILNRKKQTEEKKMATLVEQRKQLREEVESYKTMIDDVMTYLHSSKFNKFQASSPNELCDKVQVDDILRRLNIETYK
jgi:peptidoglycan hydrolase CwlO-like protein